MRRFINIKEMLAVFFAVVFWLCCGAEVMAAPSMAVVVVAPHEFHEGHFKIMTERTFKNIKSDNYAVKQGQEVQGKYREFCERVQIPMAVEISPQLMMQFVKDSGYDSALFLFVDKPLRYSAAYLAERQQVRAVVAVPGFFRQHFKDFFGDSFFEGFGESGRSQLAEYDRFLQQVCARMSGIWNSKKQSKKPAQDNRPQHPEPVVPEEQKPQHGNPVQM